MLLTQNRCLAPLAWKVRPKFVQSGCIPTPCWPINGSTHKLDVSSSRASCESLGWHPAQTDRICSVETEQMSSVATGQMSAVETGQISGAESGQMSSVETGQMSAVETGQMPAAETRQMSSVARTDICLLSQRTMLKSQKSQLWQCRNVQISDKWV